MAGFPKKCPYNTLAWHASVPPCEYAGCLYDPDADIYPTQQDIEAATGQALHPWSEEVSDGDIL